ncbi:MAG: anhydro-N-acetylmuramic acid kinase [Rhizobiaceae bacterium]|nr:anhydro-N-acetylmuramic acid kinase [Rhizobiaceae bacterium]
MTALRALGLMSGTSMDGIDLAVVTTDGESAVTRGPSMFVAYDAALRRRIEAALGVAKAISSREERPGDLADLERELTLRHARAVSAFVEAHGAVHLIGFHGQTVLHRPEQALTVQIGDGALLARETATPVVFDMRAADMVAGGQGAPLVPAYHAALAADLHGADLPACFVNIGGISNITFVAADGPPVAFDSGPGNALIDQWVSREGGVPFDQNGMIANEGGVVRGVVERYLDNPFFARSGPKSLDRNDFTLEFASGLELADGARTFAAVSAQAILKAADHMPAQPKSWIICGGGRKNPHIGADLRKGAEATGARVLLAEDVGLDGDAMEAEAWAYLAVRSMRRLPLTWPTTTGCRAPAKGGVIARPG